MESKSNSVFTKIAENPFFVFFLIVATIYAFIEPIRNAIKNDDYGTVTFYAAVFIFIIVLAAFYQAKLRSRRIQPLNKEYFKPFDLLTEDTAWPRTKDQRELLATIKNSKGQPVILVGESGVGKSVLVQTHIIPQLVNWNIITFDNYTDFQTQTKDKLLKKYSDIRISGTGCVDGLHDETTNLLIVFDQFEQFLTSHPKNTEEDKLSRNWLQNFLKCIMQIEIARILIIVRKEWYYDLKFLDEFIPPPFKSRHLTGMRVGDDEDSISTLKHKLATVMKNVKATEAVIKNLEIDGEISPVEAQIVGCMLENKISKLGEISGDTYINELGGKDALINEFFDITLRASPNQEISLQLLFALSIETRYRKSLTLSQMLGIIHKPKDEVLVDLKFLDDQRLIQEGESGHYQLRHDYLAERFHDISGSRLDPKQRDNILFFGDEIRKNHQIELTVSNYRHKLFAVPSDWFMLFLSVLLIARLIGPIYGVRWDWFNSMSKYQTTYLGFDTYYIPIFVSHLAWSYYVTIYYRRIFSLLKEGWLGRFLSYTTLVVCTAAVILATFLPCFWIFSIGWGGLVIGLKLWQLSTTPGLSFVAKEDFLVAGRETIINVIFVILLGGIFGFYLYKQQPSFEMAKLYLLISIPAMVILTYAMYVVFRLHVTKKISSVWLGMFDRRPSKPRELISQFHIYSERD